MVMRALRVILAALAVLAATTGCVETRPQPRADLINVLVQHYFECRRCGSLEGGYYGKNSVSRWNSAPQGKCRHRWREISQEVFERKWLDRAGDTTHY